VWGRYSVLCPHHSHFELNKEHYFRPKMSKSEVAKPLIETAVGDVKIALSVAPQPFLRGQLVFTLSALVSSLSEADFVATYLTIKHIMTQIDERTRYATGTEGGNAIYLYPLQKRGTPWKALNWPELSYVETYPGYIHTKSGPHLGEDRLDSLQTEITSISGWSTPSHSFPDPNDTNLFARLARGEIPQWRVWEDSDHLAFLTPFPNVRGLTVVIPRKHVSSDILALDDDDFIPLVRAAFRVSAILTKALKVDRVGVFFEGFEIDYAHVKLVPVPRTTSIDESVGSFYDTYPGYLSTQQGSACNVAEVEAGLNLERWESGSQG
jgi:diadenosine tetraphosphate (Ap4A) HIT family hydrolase